MVVDFWDALMIHIVLILCKRFDDEKNREERRKRERERERVGKNFFVRTWRQAKQHVCENLSYASNRFRNIHRVTEE